MKIKTPSHIDCNTFKICKPVNMAKQVFGYLGPGFFVTVGFIDPGNWATNIAAGSEFNYDLLWVVALSTAILILWQHMSAHLGIVKGKCLAEAVSENVRTEWKIIYGSTAVLACIATALAEILGAAIGLNILFGVPIKIGAMFSGILIVGVIWFQKYNALEKLIVSFVSIIGLCYLVEIMLVHPDWGQVAYHTFVPKLNSGSILIAMGVIGAVVMPHNMYLHSEVIQNRDWSSRDEKETRRLLKLEFLDTLVAMLVGMAINVAMVIVAASVFHRNGVKVTELVQAAATLKPLVGGIAGVVFAIALLFAGISSSMTAAMAGGTTFSGYLGKETDLSNKWFKMGMILTIIPACLIVLVVKDSFQALILSQVCLSIQLPLTMLPLFLLTSSGKVMGKYKNGRIESVAMVVSGSLIVGLNTLLIYQLFGGKF